MMSTRKPVILQTAKFVPKAPLYGALATLWPMVASIVLIPVVPLAYPFVLWYKRRYYARMSVILSRRDLIVRRGVWMREEKTIPLEKITDVAINEGPIMRWLGLKGMRVETAGQSGDQAALVNIAGIHDCDGFRDAVLDQRDKVAEGDGPTSAPSVGAEATARSPYSLGQEQPSSDDEVVALLRDIRDHLARIAPPPP
ncbi:MAG: PH domain-containing protein [Gemmatimonadota bacterium]|nr:PH domain-containing protein [Gemmatimonadota bacterium]